MKVSRVQRPLTLGVPFVVLTLAGSLAFVDGTRGGSNGAVLQSSAVEPWAVQGAPRVDVVSLQRLDLGGILHIRQTVFRRHGPWDAALTDRDPYVFPETYIREAWYRLAPGGSVDEGLGLVLNPSGIVLQRTHLLGASTTVESPVHATTRTYTHRGGGQMIDVSGLLHGAADAYEGRAAAGELENVSSATGADPSLRRYVEELHNLMPLPQTGSSGAVRVSLPYIDDLRGARFYREHVLTSDYLPVSKTTWAELIDGSRVLIEEITWDSFEGLGTEEWDRVQVEWR